MMMITLNTEIRIYLLRLVLKAVFLAISKEMME